MVCLGIRSTYVYMTTKFQRVKKRKKKQTTQEFKYTNCKS